MRVRRQFEFEAAHELPRHPGKCRNLHGHSYRLIVTVDRPVDPDSGMAIDFSWEASAGKYLELYEGALERRLENQPG